MVRPPCCDKLTVKRGLWTEEEDVKMLAYVSKHGTGNWTVVPKKAGLRRCGKSCRLRWTNYLRPDLKHESFTPQEEELIVRLHAAIGSRWSIIAQQLPGRTDNDVKNYWNTKLRKKLSEMGIDPVTHKPFSQILADYGNIGGLPKPGTRIGSLNRDLKTAFMLKLDQYRAPLEGFSNNSSNLMTSMTPPPKPEPIQDQSLDLLAQLQAIKLVVEASNCSNLETIPPHFFTEGPSMSPSSSCSSSSACSSAARERSSSQTFSWKDFLLEEPFLPADHQQGPEDMAAFLSKDLISESEVNNETNKNLHNGVPSNSFEASSSSDSSFFETLLNRDNEMFLEFHDLLEEPLY